MIIRQKIFPHKTNDRAVENPQEIFSQNVLSLPSTKPLACKHAIPKKCPHYASSNPPLYPLPHSSTFYLSLSNLYLTQTPIATRASCTRLRTDNKKRVVAGVVTVWEEVVGGRVSCVESTAVNFRAAGDRAPEAGVAAAARFAGEDGNCVKARAWRVAWIRNLGSNLNGSSSGSRCFHFWFSSSFFDLIYHLKVLEIFA